MGSGGSPRPVFAGYYRCQTRLGRLAYFSTTETTQSRENSTFVRSLREQDLKYPQMPRHHAPLSLHLAQFVF